MFAMFSDDKTDYVSPDTADSPGAILLVSALITAVMHVFVFGFLSVRSYRTGFVTHVQGVALAFYLYMAARGVISMYRNERTGHWKAYVLLCVTSPLWIWLLAEGEVIVADLASANPIRPMASPAELAFAFLSTIIMTPLWLLLLRRSRQHTHA